MSFHVKFFERDFDVKEISKSVYNAEESIVFMFSPLLADTRSYQSIVLC